MANYQNTRQWWRDRSARRFGALPGLPSLVGAGTPAAQGLIQVANEGDQVYLSQNATPYAGTTVYYMDPSGFGPATTVQAPAGAFTCKRSLFGATRSGGCYVKKSDVLFAPPPANAVHVADENQAFHTDKDAIVYYGASGIFGSSFVPRHVAPGDYVCDNQNFGPDPAWGIGKECRLAPTVAEQGAVTAGAPTTYYNDLATQYEAMQRSEAAAQAQRDMLAAQAAVLQQQSDLAAQQAQIAQNAQAQAAAALSAAETYRQIQKAAQDQAAQYAAELAKIAAASAAPGDAAAAAQAAAQKAAQDQATAQATTDAAHAQAAYDAANAAAQAEIRNQEQAAAALAAAQNAAAQQAANMLGGGGLLSGNFLLYGGLAALAAVLLLAD